MENLDKPNEPNDKTFLRFSLFLVLISILWIGKIQYTNKEWPFRVREEKIRNSSTLSDIRRIINQNIEDSMDSASNIRIRFGSTDSTNTIDSTTTISIYHIYYNKASDTSRFVRYKTITK